MREARHCQRACSQSQTCQSDKIGEGQRHQERIHTHLCVLWRLSSNEFQFRSPNRAQRASVDVSEHVGVCACLI